MRFIWLLPFLSSLAFGADQNSIRGLTYRELDYQLYRLNDPTFADDWWNSQTNSSASNFVHRYAPAGGGVNITAGTNATATTNGQLVTISAVTDTNVVNTLARANTNGLQGSLGFIPLTPAAVSNSSVAFSTNAGTAAALSGSITESQVTGLGADLSSKSGTNESRPVVFTGGLLATNPTATGAMLNVGAGMVTVANGTGYVPFSFDGTTAIYRGNASGLTNLTVPSFVLTNNGPVALTNSATANSATATTTLSASNTVLEVVANGSTNQLRMNPTNAFMVRFNGVDLLTISTNGAALFVGPVWSTNAFSTVYGSGDTTLLSIAGTIWLRTANGSGASATQLYTPKDFGAARFDIGGFGDTYLSRKSSGVFLMTGSELLSGTLTATNGTFINSNSWGNIPASIAPGQIWTGSSNGVLTWIWCDQTGARFTNQPYAHP